MKILYLISGLGADKSIFKNINIEGRKIKHIEWIEPIKNESIEKYVERLGNQIESSTKFSILGVSFGGMIATEMAKIYPPENLYLVSSAKSYCEIPLIYRIAGKLYLHKILPSSLLKKANPITYFLFGVHKKEEKIMLKNILENTDSKFLKWSIDKIVNWKNVQYPNNIIQIHGTKDRILPKPKDKSIIHLKNAGHLAIYQNAEEINNILKNKESYS